MPRPVSSRALPCIILFFAPFVWAGCYGMLQAQRRSKPVEAELVAFRSMEMFGPLRLQQKTNSTMETKGDFLWSPVFNEGVYLSSP